MKIEKYGEIHVCDLDPPQGRTPKKKKREIGYKLIKRDKLTTGELLLLNMAIDRAMGLDRGPTTRPIPQLQPLLENNLDARKLALLP